MSLKDETQLCGREVAWTWDAIEPTLDVEGGVFDAPVEGIGNMARWGREEPVVGKCAIILVLHQRRFKACGEAWRRIAVSKAVVIDPDVSLRSDRKGVALRKSGRVRGEVSF